MLSHLSFLIASIALVSALRATTPALNSTDKICGSTSPADCLESCEYYANFEAVPNGTSITNLQGLTWSGFETITLIESIIPQDCPYIGPERNTRCHYAFAGHARDNDISRLPTLVPTHPAILMYLPYFSWAAGPENYFGYPGEELQVIGLARGPGGVLLDTGARANFSYSTAFNSGAVGATMANVTMPTDFVFAGYAFNITTEGLAEPEIFLDDVKINTFSPGRRPWKEA